MVVQHPHRMILDGVFPRLADLATVVDGQGITVTVHFSKKEGAPVHYVADDSTPAAAIRQIDLQNKYHLSPAERLLAAGRGSFRARHRRHLGTDDDESARLRPPGWVFRNCYPSLLRQRPHQDA